MISLATAQVDIYVDAELGDDSWSGLSSVAGDPNGPKKTIQAAIDTAVSGDTVIAADGIYTGPGNIDLDFGHQIVGTRIITVRSANGPKGCIIDCNNTGRGFKFFSGETEAAKIEGFTIRRGIGRFEDIGGQQRPVGGAIFCENSSPTIENCVIKNNQLGFLGAGGGICFGPGANLKIINCKINNNSVGVTGAGGGIFGYGPGSSISILNCEIVGNNGSLGGGGIALDNGGEAQMINSLLTGNTAGEGGGICCWPGAFLNMTNCTVSGNTSSSNGGGVLCQNSLMVIRNCIFWSDKAGNDGDELSASGFSDVWVEYCSMEDGLLGVDINGDAVINWFNSDHFEPHFASAGYWQGMLWVQGDYHLKSLAGRWNPYFYGIGDLHPDGVVNLKDYVLFAACWLDEGSGMEADLNGDGVVDVQDLCRLAKNYLSPKQPFTGAWVVDELSSACLDLGDPGTNWRTELWPHGKRANLGVYGATTQASLSLSPWGNVADLNGDDFVGFFDASSFMGQWLVEAELLPEDLNRDGFVNLRDWAILANNWLWQQ
ncbi:MAG: hypothetical protein JXD22_02190 [Sedimentisphaerales bacterium]|nr:hypothetical protein [Sedimentisphaerales bacterium]